MYTAYNATRQTATKTFDEQRCNGGGCTSSLLYVRDATLIADDDFSGETQSPQLCALLAHSPAVQS
jgi:hypothetical protein